MSEQSASEPLDDPDSCWDIGTPVLRIREQGSVHATSALVDQIKASTWNQLGLTVRRAPSDNLWTVAASQFAGVSRLRAGADLLSIEIIPKLDGLDLFFLADWAYDVSDRNQAGRQQSAAVDVLRSDPAACLLSWYMQALTDFATRWLRRGYRTIEDDLQSRVRGRILLPRYAQHSLARGRDHVIACRFAEPTQDTPINQFLKAGLRRAVALSHTAVVPAARNHLKRLGARALALFGLVTDVRATPNDANRLTPRGPLRHYRPLIDLTRSMLTGTYINPTAGAQLHTAFLWDLNVLFEEALRNILASWSQVHLIKSRPSAQLVTGAGVKLSSHRVKPDYVVQAASGEVLLLDAKYKDTHYSAKPTVDDDDALATQVGRQRIRVRRPDVYQAVSYGNHDRWRPAAVTLVYPIVLGPREALPGPFEIREFGRPVYIHFLDVGRGGHNNLRQFYDLLGATQ